MAPEANNLLTSSGMRARHNTYMENQATADNLEFEEPSTPLQAASDYLVPLPLLSPQQVQFPRIQRSRSLQHSYETTISLSHEYEDIPDMIEDTMANRSKRIYSYDNDGSIKMERNAAYKLNKTWDSRRSAAIQCHDMVIPNPMNCFYNYRIHDEQDQEDSTAGSTRL